MQNWSKKWRKPKTMKICLNCSNQSTGSNLSEGPSRLKRTCRQDGAESSSAQRTTMRGEQCASRPNSRLHHKIVDWIIGRKFSSINPSRRQQQQTQIPAQPDFGKIITPNPEGISQCGKKQSCSQQAKEQISIKIIEIQRLDL